MSESDMEFLARLQPSWPGTNDSVRLPMSDFDRLFALARRGAAMQWRPISGPLPPEFKRLLATDGEVRGEAWRHAARFYWVDDSAAENITHWMPLPSPPKGGAR